MIYCYDCTKWKNVSATYDPLVSSPDFKYNIEDMIVETTGIYIAFAAGYVLKLDSSFGIIWSNRYTNWPSYPTWIALSIDKAYLFVAMRTGYGGSFWIIKALESDFSMTNKIENAPYVVDQSIVVSVTRLLYVNDHKILLILNTNDLTLS